MQTTRACPRAGRLVALLGLLSAAGCVLVVEGARTLYGVSHCDYFPALDMTPGAAGTPKWVDSGYSAEFNGKQHCPSGLVQARVKINGVRTEVMIVVDYVGRGKVGDSTLLAFIPATKQVISFGPDLLFHPESVASRSQAGCATLDTTDNAAGERVYLSSPGRKSSAKVTALDEDGGIVFDHDVPDAIEGRLPERLFRGVQITAVDDAAYMLVPMVSKVDGTALKGYWDGLDDAPASNACVVHCTSQQTSSVCSHNYESWCEYICDPSVSSMKFDFLGCYPFYDAVKSMVVRLHVIKVDAQGHTDLGSIKSSGGCALAPTLPSYGTRSSGGLTSDGYDDIRIAAVNKPDQPLRILAYVCSSLVEIKLETAGKDNFVSTVALVESTLRAKMGTGNALQLALWQSTLHLVDSRTGTVLAYDVNTKQVSPVASTGGLSDSIQHAAVFNDKRCPEQTLATTVTTPNPSSTTTTTATATSSTTITSTKTTSVTSSSTTTTTATTTSSTTTTGTTTTSVTSTTATSTSTSTAATTTVFSTSPTAAATTAAAKITGSSTATETSSNAATDNKSNVAADAGGAAGSRVNSADTGENANSTDSSAGSGGNSPSIGMIIGIVIVIVCLLAGAFIFLRRTKTADSTTEVAWRAAHVSAGEGPNQALGRVQAAGSRTSASKFMNPAFATNHSFDTRARDAADNDDPAAARGRRGTTTQAPPGFATATPTVPLVPSRPRASTDAAAVAAGRAEYFAPDSSQPAKYDRLNAERTAAHIYAELCENDPDYAGLADECNKYGGVSNA